MRIEGLHLLLEVGDTPGRCWKVVFGLRSLATIQNVWLEPWLNKYDLELSHVLSSYVVQGNFLAPSSSGYLVVSSLIRDLNFPLFVISDVLNFENRSLVLQGAWEDCGWMLAFVHWKWKG